MDAPRLPKYSRATGISTSVRIDPDQARHAPGDLVASVGEEALGVGIGTRARRPRPGRRHKRVDAHGPEHRDSPFVPLFVSRRRHERGLGIPAPLREETCPHLGSDHEGHRTDSRSQPAQDLSGRHREPGDGRLDDTPFTKPRQPACTAATQVPAASHSNSGRQSVVSTVYTSRGPVAITASARQALGSLTASATLQPWTCRSQWGSAGKSRRACNRARFCATRDGSSPT